MNYYEMSPHLISKIEEIIDHDYRAMGLLAEIVDEIRDPTLRAIMFSIIGDENGHVRFFRSLLSQATQGSSRHCCHRYDNSQRNRNFKRNYLAKTKNNERKCTNV